MDRGGWWATVHGVTKSAGMRAETYFLQHQKRRLWTFSLLRGRVLSTVLRLDVRDVLEHLKLTVLPNHLGILRKCRFWLSTSGVGRDTAFFFFGLETCGIFPNQGWNPCPLHWEHRVLTMNHQGVPVGTSNALPANADAAGPGPTAGMHVRTRSVIPDSAVPWTVCAHALLHPTLQSRGL